MELHNIQKHEDIQTPQELIDKAVAVVERYLQEMFPDFVAYGNNSYTLRRGSSIIMVVVRPFTEQEVCVECIANVVVDATITPELMRYLLRKNAELHFGGFGLLFDDTITFSYSIPAANLNDNEFLTAVNAVAIVADHYDDKIVAIAGGKRACDVEFKEFEL